ncbi:hypothetical protein GJ496_003703 [Pomphorhynchus laevis]|nr:hypothetical protein GJ496_003703 [Pomphorhynchus laevis]
MWKEEKYEELINEARPLQIMRRLIKEKDTNSDVINKIRKFVHSESLFQASRTCQREKQSKENRVGARYDRGRDSYSKIKIFTSPSKFNRMSSYTKGAYKGVYSI